MDSIFECAQQTHSFSQISTLGTILNTTSVAGHADFTPYLKKLGNALRFACYTEQGFNMEVTMQGCSKQPLQDLKRKQPPYQRDHLS